MKNKLLRLQWFIEDHLPKLPHLLIIVIAALVVYLRYDAEHGWTRVGLFLGANPGAALFFLTVAITVAGLAVLHIITNRNPFH